MHTHMHTSCLNKNQKTEKKNTNGNVKKRKLRKKKYKNVQLMVVELTE